jgi:IS30 family transposase
MAKTAQRERHIDSEYLATGTHGGTDSATTLRDRTTDFFISGAIADLYIENTTSGESSLIATVKEHEITTDDSITWNNGDTYEIYKTGTKNSAISSTWCDVSRGWKINKHDEVNRHGWRWADVDVDDKGRKDVFGPGFPEKY